MNQTTDGEAPKPVFQVYNTAARKVEPIEPVEPGHLRFYACGPTVYSYAHIGNFRSFLTADLIARTARALGWSITYVTNITDVGHLTQDDLADAGGEDRMEKALRSMEGRQFANIWDLADHYTQELKKDWRRLNLIEPDVRPRATQHIREQILGIAKLIETGKAYETEKGVYFSVQAFPDYGKLSGNTLAEQLEQGVRDVVRDEDKRDPRDFALWKKDEKHLMQWYSPWGWGFPGWHIECSVMAMAYLGETIDLHAGGEDLIFPHHDCEIAQSESITGRPFARYWVHTRFLQVEGEKMSKSKGNYFTVRELVDPGDEGGRGVDPLALRYALISGHYRKPLNFTLDHLAASARVILRYQEADKAAAAGIAGDLPGEDEIGQTLQSLFRDALRAMADDLNTPEALAAGYEGTRVILGAGKLTGASARSARAFLDKVNALLGIVRHEAPDARPEAPAADEFARRVERLLEERADARRERNFARADAIRTELDEMGVEVMDSREGTTWRRKVSV